MTKLLQDIWVLIQDSGVVLYHRVFDEKVDVQLFGGLMSALNSFAEVLSKEGLTSFELSSKKFSILKRKNILFIGNAPKDVKDRKIVEELNNIADKFFEIYGRDISEYFDGDITVFKDFENKIKNSLEDTIKKFEKAFW
ncbi:MAG: hypothetical protein EU550_03535 [Promethearchaeota archaeon]|nr:MAG: hypothetical protein EU550_03535 [Candidatus Lokiarchaeota archaeon]